MLKFLNQIDHGLLYEVLVALPFLPALALLNSVAAVVRSVKKDKEGRDDGDLLVMIGYCLINQFT